MTPAEGTPSQGNQAWGVPSSDSLAAPANSTGATPDQPPVPPATSTEWGTRLMIRRLLRTWWPAVVMLVLGLVGSTAVLAGIVLLVTGARDQPPAHSPPAPTTTVVVVPGAP